MADKKDKAFEAEVEKALEEVVAQHGHQHPLYKPTRVTEQVLDSKAAAFILFEQIDTDRLTEEGEGWLGDQFRYSLWIVKPGQKPRPRFFLKILIARKSFS